MSGADLSRIVAIVPVRSLSGAKSRLGEPLDPEERAELILALLRRTVAAALAARSLDGVAVVSQDADLLERARTMGAASLLQESDGLNEGLTETRDSACAEATALLVLPADLPANYLDADQRHGAVVDFTDERDGYGTRVTSRKYADGYVVIETPRASRP